MITIIRCATTLLGEWERRQGRPSLTAPHLRRAGRQRGPRLFQQAGTAYASSLTGAKPLTMLILPTLGAGLGGQGAQVQQHRGPGAGPSPLRTCHPCSGSRYRRTSDSPDQRRKSAGDRGGSVHASRIP